MKMKYIQKIKANITISATKKTTNILDGNYKSIYKGKTLNFEDLTLKKEFSLSNPSFIISLILFNISWS